MTGSTSTLKEWISVTSWHGVADVVRTNSSFSKVLWICVLLGTAFMFCYQVFVQFKNFISAGITLHINFVEGLCNSQQVNSSTKIVATFGFGHGLVALGPDRTPKIYHYVEPTSVLHVGNQPWIESTTTEDSPSLPLPIVTVCSMNLVSVLSLQALNMSAQAASSIIGIYRGMYDSNMGEISKEEIYGNNTWMRTEFLNYLDTHADMNGLSLYDWMILLGPHCSAVLKLHMFINHQYTVDCTNASRFFSTSGLCYSLEPRTPDGNWTHQRAAGYENSLELWIYIPKDDYAAINDSRGFDLGVSLYIGFDAVATVLGKRLVLAPGHHTWISLELSVDKEPDTPVLPIFDFAVGPWPCAKETSKTTELVDTDAYTTGVCSNDCVHTAYFNQCGCIPFASFPISNTVTYPRCPLETSLACKDQVSAEVFEQCERRCSLSGCNAKYVAQFVTSVPFPADPPNRARNLKIYFGEDYDENNVTHWTVANIFYKRMVTKVSQYRLRTSVEELISNVGGQLGLWAGISIITLYQALVYAIYACIHWFMPPSTHKQRRKSKSGSKI